jgi:DNA end-binding protein Ku
VSFPVALYTAASTAERIAFHTLNRKTGNRVKREFIDSETSATVDREDQVKGYELDNGDYVVLEPEDVAAAVPESDKTLALEAFVPCSQLRTEYFDKPYYLTPDDVGRDAYVLLRDAMKKEAVVAIAHTVLFRRMRTVLIRAHGQGLIASTLNFDYEVRSSEEAFKELPDLKIEGEMMELAKHIIGAKKGRFDAGDFDDRYEAAVAELVKAKIEGRAPAKRAAPVASKPGDLLQALRDSAGGGAKKAKPKRAANANKSSSRKKQTENKKAATPARRAR